MAQPTSAVVIEDLIDQYRARGYETTRSLLGLPDDVRDLQPDLVARRGNDVVLVEVRSRGALQEPGVVALAEAAERHGWRLDLVVVPGPAYESTAAAVQARADMAEDLLASNQMEAALLIAWSSLEGALRMLASETAEDDDRLVGVRLLDHLYSVGWLTDGQHERARTAADLRGHIAHGGHSQRVPEDLVNWTTATARYLVSADRSTVDDMIEWFRERYEDPANGVPFDSGEGGYQYFAGGPFDAREIVDEQFPGVPDDVREEVVDILESESTEWVEKGQY